MRLAACLYVRDEAADIAEWLAFHHVVGVDHILVFDNGSRDATRAVVRAAARHASITLLPWPVSDKRAQKLAYAAGLLLLRRFDWVAFIDADEFLTPLGCDDLKAVLAPLEAADAVAVNTCFFGSSGHVARPPGLQVEAYTRRAPDDFPENRLVKSIVRPNRVRAENPHRFTARTYLTPSAVVVQWAGEDRIAGSPNYERCRVAHYFTRSQDDFDRKINRGYRDIVRPASAFGAYDRNEVEDSATARFAPAIRAELARRGQACAAADDPLPGRRRLGV